MLRDRERRAILQVRSDDLDADRQSARQTSDGNNGPGRTRTPAGASESGDSSRTWSFTPHRRDPCRDGLGVIVRDRRTRHHRQKHRIPLAEELFHRFRSWSRRSLVGEPLAAPSWRASVAWRRAASHLPPPRRTRSGRGARCRPKRLGGARRTCPRPSPRRMLGERRDRPALRRSPARRQRRSEELRPRAPRDSVDRRAKRRSDTRRVPGVGEGEAPDATPDAPNDSGRP